MTSSATLLSGSKRGLFTVMAILAFMVGGLIGYFGLQYLVPEPVEVTAQPIEAPKLNATEVIQRINGKLKADFTNIDLEISQDTSPAYKPKPSNYYLTYEDAPKLTISQNLPAKEDEATTDEGSETKAESEDKAEDEPVKIDKKLNKEVLDSIKNTLKEVGFSRSIGTEDFSERQSDQVVCIFSRENNEPVIIRCADKSGYETASQVMQPFIDALDAKEENAIPTSTILATPELADSQSDGYQLATIHMTDRDTMADYTGLFYKKSDGDWQFFAQKQDESLICDQYEGKDLQTAYKGHSCLDPMSGQERDV